MKNLSLVFLLVLAANCFAQEIVKEKQLNKEDAELMEYTSVPLLLLLSSCSSPADERFSDEELEGNRYLSVIPNNLIFIAFGR